MVGYLFCGIDDSDARPRCAALTRADKAEFGHFSVEVDVERRSSCGGALPALGVGAEAAECAFGAPVALDAGGIRVRSACAGLGGDCGIRALCECWGVWWVLCGAGGATADGGYDVPMTPEVFAEN